MQDNLQLQSSFMYRLDQNIHVLIRSELLAACYYISVDKALCFLLKSAKFLASNALCRN